MPNLYLRIICMLFWGENENVGIINNSFITLTLTPICYREKKFVFFVSLFERGEMKKKG